MEKVNKEELEKWKKRVFYPDEVFKEDTKANMKNLSDFLDKAREQFVVICSSSEVSVYKIGRFMVEKGISNDSITFQDGVLFDSYIDTNTRFDYQFRELCNELSASLKQKVYKKWLIVPNIDCVWTKKVALFFLNQLEQMGCYGLLFYSPDEVNGNLAQILCEDSCSGQYLQFPKTRYFNKSKDKPLEDDGF